MARWVTLRYRSAVSSTTGPTGCAGRRAARSSGSCCAAATPAAPRRRTATWTSTCWSAGARTSRTRPIFGRDRRPADPPLGRGHVTSGPGSTGSANRPTGRSGCRSSRRRGYSGPTNWRSPDRADRCSGSPPGQPRAGGARRHPRQGERGLRGRRRVRRPVRRRRAGPALPVGAAAGQPGGHGRPVGPPSPPRWTCRSRPPATATTC